MVVLKYVIDSGHISDWLTVDTKSDGVCVGLCPMWNDFGSVMQCAQVLQLTLAPHLNPDTSGSHLQKHKFSTHNTISGHTYGFSLFLIVIKH